MRPRVRHPQTVNRPDLSHSTLDIDGAQPHCRNLFQHPRNTDPLSPCYKLADGCARFIAGSSCSWQWCEAQLPTVRTRSCAVTCQEHQCNDTSAVISACATPVCRSATATLHITLRQLSVASVIPGVCRCCCPCSPTLALPSGAAPVDKCLGDPLDVSDIPGACRKQQQPCSRPGQLDVSDIEGANAAWRPHHRCAWVQNSLQERLQDAGYLCMWQLGCWHVGIADFNSCRFARMVLVHAVSRVQQYSCAQATGQSPAGSTLP
jgi:hypothetical protein